MAIKSNEKKCLICEGLSSVPSDNEKGGIIVFPTDTNTSELSSSNIAKFLKEKLSTIVNSQNATKNIDDIAKSQELVGWTIGHYLNGSTAKNGKEYGENSLSVEIIGVYFYTLYQIAVELCSTFNQEGVLLKDFSTHRVLLVRPN